MVSRRNIINGILLSLGALLTNRANALTAIPRQRIIIDNDFSGDPDGLFQLAHHLCSKSVEIPLIIASHTHENDFIAGKENQAENGVIKVNEIFKRLKITKKSMVVAGHNHAPLKSTSLKSKATDFIINEALKDDKFPLYYCAGAGLTELAEAYKHEPKIAKRLKLIWIGGMEHKDLLPGIPPRTDIEYNFAINIEAVKTIFNDSEIEIWQIPRNSYRTLIISHEELNDGLKGTGTLGKYLLDQLDFVIKKFKDGLGETYILGDSPLVTLTALQSQFDPDSASSQYIVKPTPIINENGDYKASNSRPMRVYSMIDSRLSFEDMFAKFRKFGI